MAWRRVFDPIWEEVNRRGLASVYYVSLRLPAAGRWWPGATLAEYGADTTRTIGSLILKWKDLEVSNIKFIFSHAGGMMPFLIERF
jgi:hypothetical protein